MSIRSMAASAIALVALTAAPVQAQSLPAEVAGDEPAAAKLRESGAGPFRYWGFHVYDARLWIVGERHDPAGLYALGLRYARAFTGEEIARSSTDEIRRLGAGSNEQIARWDAAMKPLFPAVKRGDEIVGVHRPGIGARFYHNGRALGEIADPAFARAFFAIWLDPRTRGPELRRALLGDG